MTNEELLKHIRLFAAIFAQGYAERVMARYKNADNTLVEAEIEFERIKEEINKRANYIHSYKEGMIRQMAPDS